MEGLSAVDKGCGGMIVRRWRTWEYPGVTMDTLREVLAQGLEYERRAYRFYIDRHRLTTHQGARVLLMELAAEELRHIDLFERAIRGDVVEFGAGAPGPKQDLGLAQRLKTPVLEENSDTADVLIVAMKLELAAVQRYEQWSVDFAGTLLGDLSRHLAAEERAHKYRLELLYDDQFQR